MKHINRIFFTFLIAYSVLILIPLTTGTAMNRAIVREYEQDVKKSYLINLKKTQDVLEGFMDNIKWSTYQLAGNTQLLKLISEDNKSLSNMEQSLLIRATMMELKNSLLYNASNHSIFYIYLKNRDLIITPYSVYRRSDFNSSKNFFHMATIESSAWHEMITNSYHTGKIYPVRNTVIEDFKNKPMIPYVQSIPVNSVSNKIDGAIVYLIGESDFVKFLDYKNIPVGGYSYISDDKNNIISKISNSDIPIKPLELDGDEGMIEMVLDGERKFIIYTTSSKNSWKYVSVLPEKVVLKSVIFYQFLSIAVMTFALVLSLFLAFKISKTWSTPIVSTLTSVKSFLKKELNEDDSFKSLSSSVNELIDRGENMQDELLNQKFFLHNAFVNRLINGFFNNEKSVSNYLSQLGFDFTERSFSAVILSLKGDISNGSTESFDELIRVKNIAKNWLQQNFIYRIMISEQENSDIILIALTDEKENHLSNLRSALLKFTENMPPLYNDNLIIGLGDPVLSLMDIHKSFIQAKEIVSSNQEESCPLILTVNDIDKKLDHYYYPIELESRLINSLKAGSIHGLESILTILHQENIEHRILDSKLLNAFTENLLSSIFRVKSQLCKSNIEFIDSYKKGDNLSFEEICRVFRHTCEIQNKNKKSHNNSLVDDIIEYLKTNYKDSNLSLNSVGDHFSITESYLSFFFKEQTGINFSTFLEELRLEEGKMLLTTTSLPIHKIANTIGYNSDKTFRRVFQKTLHISPSKFRSES